MLDLTSLQALLGGYHHDPFAVLGWHPQTLGSVIRVFIPGATQIELLDADGGIEAKFEADLRADELQYAMLKTSQRLEYQLRVQFASGASWQGFDPYQFSSTLSDVEKHALNSGQLARSYEVLGAHLVKVETPRGQVSGVRFAVWAPNAKRVSVVGDFNQWDGRRHVMRLHHGAGIWEIFIPGIVPGDLYKYELLDGNGTLLPLKADPYARAAELRPGTASKVCELLPRASGLATRKAANARGAPISIYEVHLGSWQTKADGGFLTWRELAERLPAYAKDLGFTHIELMPISEFPFDGSWGYQTLGLFAPTSRFGSQEDFRYFVDTCHAQDLGLILDWVPAHFPVDGHGLHRFDGTALYEYADPKEGFHKDWNTAIYNFSRNEVRQFLIASALYWPDRFNVDGLRVDAVASMLYRDYSRNSGEWVPNQYGGRENLEAISLFKALNECLGNEVSGSITIAEESTAFPQVSAPTYAGGLGFHFKWNMGWMNDTLRYIQEDPVHRKYHHDLMSFGLVYAFSENYVLPISHDEVVHGKGSLWQKMPGDEWQKFANVRAYLGFMWAHPGKKLLFMGQEFAQRDEWNHEQGLPWYVLQYPEHQGVQNLVRDLNKLYRSQLALHQQDCQSQGFQWLALHDRDTSVLAFARFSGSGECVIAVANFTPIVRRGYRIAVPDSVLSLREILNTDSAHYGGSNVGNGAIDLAAEAQPHQGLSQSIALDLAPLATHFFLTKLRDVG